MTTETKIKHTELYEDNAGGLHIVTYAEGAGLLLIDEMVYHIGDNPTSTYAEDIADQSWLYDMQVERPDDVEFAQPWLDACLYDSIGMRKTDGGMILIAESDDTARVTHQGTPGRSGEKYLGIEEE